MKSLLCHEVIVYIAKDSDTNIMASTSAGSNNSLERKDIIALFLGIAFSVLFTGLIWLTGPLLIPKESTFLPDQGALWYFWKLADPTFWTRFVAWSTYILHQVTIWGLIYYAQTRVKKYTTSLHLVNVLALGANAIFIFIHYIVTYTTYDGLAQDVSILSSQGSVIVLLVFVLIMENNRRGMFFGKRAPIKKEFTKFLRKYHGYYFAWAVIFTFHYHPMTYTIGHLWGFFYTFLLMLQGSLFYTRIHTNKYWMVLQEVLVLIHGTIVAYAVQSSSLWTMFFYGFLLMFLITQVYAFGYKRRTRVILWIITLTSLALVYSGILVPGKNWFDLNEIIRIPVILYGLAFLFTFIFLLIYGIKLLLKRISMKRSSDQIAEIPN